MVFILGAVMMVNRIHGTQCRLEAQNESAIQKKFWNKLALNLEPLDCQLRDFVG